MTQSNHQDTNQINVQNNIQNLQDADIPQVRDLIAEQLHDDDLNNEAWWLLGTVGCHLCDGAENMLRLFSGVVPINFQNIDIADFDEALMNQFATTIPVILTPTQRLNYPFSVADLMSLHK